MEFSFFNVAGAVFIASMSMTANAAVYYVKPGGTGTGSSWTDAMGNPQTAINAAAATGTATETPDIIAVAAGIYLPPGSSGDRNRAFMPKQDMRIYGGFDTGEVFPTNLPTFEENLQAFLRQRDLLANPTILSGDIAGTPSDHTDDAYHVVYIKGYCTATCCVPESCTKERLVTESTQLDGFVITKGNADGTGAAALSEYGGGILIYGARPIIQNCDIVGNRADAGGGAHSEGVAGFIGYGETAAHPQFISCRIRSNIAETVGGYCNKYDRTTLINCEVSGNQATAGNCGGVLSSPNGGGSFAKRVDLINCTVANNSASGDGGGLTNGGNMFVYNTIIWGNTASNHPSVASGGTITIDRCTIQGTLSLGGTSTVNNVLTSDPQFMSATNLRIDGDSLSRNAGLNTHTPIDTYEVDNVIVADEKAPDRDRLPRIRNTTVDHGAYENHASSTCCADIAPPGGDGVVNVQDLLAVIAGGGSAGVADIALECGGDGTVDTQDLLLIISSWSSELNPCVIGSTYNAGSISSVQDCMDAASEVYEAFSPEWDDFVAKCVQALCEAEIINCD